MKLFLVILILAAFLQTTFIPFNLCLILLICRSFVSSENQNLVIALLIGIFLSLLTSQNIGFWALIFLSVVKLTQLTKIFPITNNFLTILPTTLFMVTLVSFLENLFHQQSLNFLKIIFETFLSLPFYLSIRFWEERFIVDPEIKLKIKK